MLVESQTLIDSLLLVNRRIVSEGVQVKNNEGRVY
jgi:hypothetical protein